MRFWRYGLLTIGAGAATLAALGSADAFDRSRAASGKTQVVARVDDEEITIADLRGEITRMGVSPNDPSAERVALDRIITRRLLADAARAARLDRQPEVLRQMAAAEEQALADIYLATTSRPAEPTRNQIEDYVLKNPLIFKDRRIYTFSVLTIATRNFDEPRHSPLFNDTADFSALKEQLDIERVDYLITASVQPSETFPEAVRAQLAAYDVNDNIVIRGTTQTQIMKITEIERAPRSGAAAQSAAREAILQGRTAARAEALIDRLKADSSLSYYRRSAAPEATTAQSR